jgi:hypothetical protein
MEILKEDIDLVRLALSVYHTRTVYPGCVEAFDRILSAQQVKAETVDFEELKERLCLKLSRLIPHSFSETTSRMTVDLINDDFNITRKTK